MAVVFIYGLFCPLEKKIKYIGKTSLPLSRRVSMHISGANKTTTTKKNIWLLSLAVLKKRPEIILLETTSSGVANIKEKGWISKIGIENLVNGNIGGGGNNCLGVYRNNAYKTRFCNYLSNSKYSKRSESNYLSYLSKFIYHFRYQQVSPKEINCDAIEKYLLQFVNKNTRNAHIVALKLFYKKIMNQPNKLKNIQYEYL